MQKTPPEMVPPKYLQCICKDLILKIRVSILMVRLEISLKRQSGENEKK